MKECKVCLNLTKNILCNQCEVILPRIEKFHELGEATTPLEKFFLELKDKNKNRKYDAVMGISGGVDSTFLATFAGELGLRVLLLHFDNGWNTQIATSNIAKLVKKYNFELRTFVQDWHIFKSLQRSFLYAGVPDLELISDHAIFAVINNDSSKKECPDMVAGSNFTTEHGLIEDFVWNKLDRKNIEGINSSFENIDLKSFPRTNIISWGWRRVSSTSKIHTPLNMFWYKRSMAVKFLKEKINFEDYSYKHEESLITKIYQRIILRDKFKHNKIFYHLNALIRNKEISKEDAKIKLNEFKESNIDKYELDYFLHKLDITYEEWDKILNSKPRRHEDFPNSQKIYNILRFFADRLKLRSMN